MIPFPPIDSTMTEAIHATFAKSSNSVMVLTGMILIVRFTFLAIQVSGPSEYFRAIKEALALMIVVAVFPSVLTMAIDIIGDIAGQFQFQRSQSTEGAMHELSLALKNESFWLRLLLDFGWYALEYSVRAIFSIFLGLMCAALPIILLIEFTFGAKIGIASIGTMILAMLSWPILWNIIGLLAEKLAITDGGASFSGWIYSIVTSLIQLLSPIFCFSLLRTAFPQTAVSAALGVSGIVPNGAKLMAMKSIGFSPKAPLGSSLTKKGGRDVFLAKK